MLGNYSQCSNCGKTFVITAYEVLYCSSKCKDTHDLFLHKEHRNKQCIAKKLKLGADWKMVERSKYVKLSVGMAEKGHSRGIFR
jgi:hypothetical protein